MSGLGLSKLTFDNISLGKNINIAHLQLPDIKLNNLYLLLKQNKIIFKTQADPIDFTALKLAKIGPVAKPFESNKFKLLQPDFFVAMSEKLKKL